MSQWKTGQLLACGNSLEKPGRAAGKSRSCLPLPRFASPGAGEVASTLGLPKEQMAAPSPWAHISALCCIYLGNAIFVPGCPMCSTGCQMQGKSHVPKSVPVGFECPVHGAYSWGVYIELCCPVRNFPKPMIALLDLGIGLGQPFLASQLL